MIARAAVYIVPLLGLTALPAGAQLNGSARNGHRQVIVLLVPGLGPNTIDRIPSLRDLQKSALVGWMNVRTARVPGSDQQTAEQREAASLLSLNSGTRAASPTNPSTGSMSELIQANAGLDHEVHIGRLGDVLHAAGLRTAAISSDESARLIAIDSAGRVDFDTTGGDMRIADRAVPYGVRDFDPVREGLAYDAPADLFVFGFWDLERAEAYAPLCLPGVADDHRRQAQERLDRWVHKLSGLTGNAFLIVLSPVAPPGARASDHLAPILVAGPGIQKGWITSPSTRRPGIVTNYDFVPTACSLLGIQSPREAIGRPMKRDDGYWSSLSLSQQYDQFADRAFLQSTLGGLPTLQWICVIAGSLLLLPANGAMWLRSVARASAGFVLALPLLLLIVPHPSESPLAAVALTILGLFVLVEMALWLVGVSTAVWIGLAPALLAGLIFCDLALHGPLLQSGLMSYSVMEGARYYGIGNEYGGAVIGAILALGFLCPARRLMMVVSLVAMSILMGLPQHGANFGVMIGGLVAAGGFAAAAWPARRKLIFVAGVIAVISAGAGLLLLDSLRGADSQSHIGRALSGGIVAIASRKLWLNLYLVTHSPWSLALIFAAGAIWLIRKRFPEPDSASAITGLATGGVGLFLFNDSGVVAAACCALPVWAAVCLTAAAKLPQGTKDDSDSRSVASAA